MIKKRQRSLVVLPILAGLFLAACSVSQTPVTPEPPTRQQGTSIAEPTKERQTIPEPANPPVDEPQPIAQPPERPAWHLVTLTDVRTGQGFTIEDFAGKVVILEAMAVWCPLCDQQQLQIQTSLSQLDDRVVVVSLDVDPTESAEILAAHADDLGLTWHFALAGPELSAMLQNEFGPQILAPPSTPVIIVGPDGEAHLTPFGIKSSTELISFVESLLS